MLVQHVSLVYNMFLQCWQPLICEGTGVAYSLAPEFQPIIIFNEWPIHDRELPQDNVKTTVAYDQFGKLFET